GPSNRRPPASDDTRCVAAWRAVSPAASRTDPGFTTHDLTSPTLDQGGIQMLGRRHLMRDWSGRRAADSGKAWRRGRAYRAAVEGLEGRALLATSRLVYPGADGHLLYTPDVLGNRVEDFSDVGYMSGTVPLPDTPGGVTVQVRVTLCPTGGDQTARIQ